MMTAEEWYQWTQVATLFATLGVAALILLAAALKVLIDIRTEQRRTNDMLNSREQRRVASGLPRQRTPID